MKKGLLKEYQFIARCIFKNMSNEQISKILNCSVSTVSNRTSVLFKQCGAKTRFDFVLNILSEIIKRQKEVINNCNLEINYLNKKISSMKNILENIINNQGVKPELKLWIGRAEEYFQK